MAELPELTVYAEVLAPLLAGRTLVDAEIHHVRVLRGVSPERFRAQVQGGEVARVARRGKTLAVTLAGGDRVDIHFMLAGEPYHLAAGAAAKVPQPALTLAFGDGARLVLSDRHFDPMKPAEPRMWVGLNRKDRAGLDPLEPAFTVEALAALCARNKLLPIKTVLCDQRLVSGLGNAYADEILWEARVKPRRTASLMAREEVERVHAAIARVVAASVEALRALLGGRLEGEPRRDFFRVHHRSRKPCPRCGGSIAFESLRDRPTNWCPACQG